jgi:hypothetical protein
MTIDLSKYNCHLPWMKKFMDKERETPGFDRSKNMGMYSATSHVPIIAVMHLYGELYGYDDELKEDINFVAKFYRYTEIKGGSSGD